MTDFFALTLKDIGALIVASFALWRYRDTRSRELKWKRTEFLFSQAHYLDNDPQIQRAVRVLSGLDTATSIDALFGPYAEIADREAEYRACFDKLLNLLDRLAYAVCNVKSLTMDEVANFGWYYRAVASHLALKGYCERHGFPDVVRFAPKIQDFLNSRYEPYEVGQASDPPRKCAA